MVTQAFQLTLTRRDTWIDEVVGYYATHGEAWGQGQFFLGADEFRATYIRAIVRPRFVDVPDTKA